MSSFYKRGNTYAIRVPTRSGYTVRTTGTGHRPTARAMERMFEALGPRGQRAWDVIEAVIDHRITVGQLFDAFSANALDELRAQLDDVDLNTHIAGWQADLRTRLGPDAETAKHYLSHVRTLIEEGRPFFRSELKYEQLVKWLASRPVGPSTKRKYHASMSSFCEYLRLASILERNPMRDVKAPAPAPPRVRYLEMPELEGLLNALPEPHRALSALMHGTGMEISAVLKLKRSDVDAKTRTCEARGTKTRWRHRRVFIADWAWPYVEQHIALLTPEAMLFPGIDRWMAGDAHREACKVRGIVDYHMHDARHTYAVRAIRAGAAFEVVRKQLGHKDTTMVIRVYGRFEPRDEEMRSWEERAAELDRAAARR